MHIGDAKECKGCEMVDCWVPIPEKNAVRRCEHYPAEVAKRKILKMVGAAGDYVRLPTFTDLKHDINNMQPVVKYIRSFPKTRHNFLFLSSPNGTGKTHLMLSLLNQVLKAGETAYYISAIRLKGLWVKQAKGELELIDSGVLREFVSSRWKFIDELGGEGRPDFFEGKLAELLDRYYDRFVIASNLDPERGATKLSYTDQRLLSRLSNAKVVRWSGRDYRKIKMMEDYNGYS